jgi:sortase A
VEIDLVRTRKLELVLVAAGVILLTAWAGAYVHRNISAHMAIARFQTIHAHAKEISPNTAVDPVSGTHVDFSLWDAKRVAEYKESLITKADAPPALLFITKINLEVPVYEGTDDLTLDRGAGRIIGTAKFGEIGNIGIAGHRDGFFRGLKDLAPKDEIKLVLPEKTQVYVVTQIHLVDPKDVSVLKPTQVPTLTLVTCYPFYYIGSAPQRFIVQASLKEPDPAHPQSRP